MNLPDDYSWPPEKSGIKDNFVIAAASLVGCLYGVAAATMITAACAAGTVALTVAAAVVTAKRSYSMLVNDKAPLDKVAGMVATGVVTTAVLPALGAVITAFAALSSMVVLPPTAAITCADYAKSNSSENFLPRIFGSYKAIVSVIIRAAETMKHRIEQSQLD